MKRLDRIGRMTNLQTNLMSGAFKGQAPAPNIFTFTTR